MVNEVSSVHLMVKEKGKHEEDLSTNNNISDDSSESECDYHHLQNRTYMAKNYLRHGQPRYAFKTLSANVLDDDDDDRIYKGIVDLAIEFKFLSVFQHPHIIKMRAVSLLADNNPCKPDFFVVVDRLSETLERRIFKWRQRSHNICATFFDRLFMGGKSTKDLWLTRLIVAIDLASAFRYLHQYNILYRDLKPENVGFDLRDDIKLFDFGLATEVRAEDKLPNGLYKLTGFTGSLRYMAPEVFHEEPYDFRADVYSFGILLWYILALEVPFATYNMNLFKKVVIGKGVRPELNPTWTESIRDLLEHCWSTTISERPTFDDIYEMLKKEIIEASGEDMDDVLDISNKTEKSLRGH